MDVGQGDGAVLISPGGQIVSFDAGEDLKERNCIRPVCYLDQLGVKHIDYLFVSHYHSITSGIFQRCLNIRCSGVDMIGARVTRERRTRNM
jgi:beta-lactamase superfamily II metal-dependent hydrolase